MTLRLSYIGIEAVDLDAWHRFGDLVGLQIERDRDCLYFRVDDRARRIIVTKGARDDVVWIGSEVDSNEDLDASVRRIRASGQTVQDGTPADAALRAVERFARFVDPNGTPMELTVGPRLASTSFRSPRIKYGFVTGALGLGHVVVPTDDYKKGGAFCLDFQSAAPSDHIFMLSHHGAFEASFLHTNPRHHSIAYVQSPMPRNKRVHHFVIHCREIEDVGRAYDRLEAAGMSFGMTLGRHTNNKKISFYVQTPSGFFLEVGAGGVQVDDSNWTPATYAAAGLWGHERPLTHR